MITRAHSGKPCRVVRSEWIDAWQQPGALLPMSLLATLIVWRHRSNVRDLFAGITDIIGGRSGAYEAKLADARETALREMLWFLTGDTNIRPLVAQGVRIWTDWPLATYRRETGEEITQKEFEQRIIEDAIARCNGNIGLAAQALELSPSTIYRKRLAWAELEARQGAA